MSKSDKAGRVQLHTESSYVLTSNACLQYRAFCISSSFSSYHCFTCACDVTLTTLMISTAPALVMVRCKLRRSHQVLTVVGGNQLVQAVVGLAALDRLPAVVCSLRKLVRPVHPVDSRIHVVFVARANLQDAGDPIIVGFLPILHRLVVVDSFLALDARVVCDIDKSFAEILDPIDCATKQMATLVRSAWKPA